jgi:site-specific DNA-methyltransferase (adenine-specific)
MEINKIYNMDCLEGMNNIPSKSIDLIILDPPYNIGKDTWDVFNTHEEYLNFIRSVIKESERVLKDNGSLYIWHNQFEVINDFYNLFKTGTEFIFKQLITWNKIDLKFKNKGFVTQRLAIDGMRNYYNGFTEYLLYYTFQDETGLELVLENHIRPIHPFATYLKSEFERAGVTRKEIAGLFPSMNGGLTGCVSNWLNGDNVITKEQYLKIRKYLNNEYLRKEYEDLRKEYEDLRYVFNVTNANKDIRGNSNVWIYEPETGEHPTQKPVSLCENIIKHSSNAKDTVLIPFVGSGSEIVACKRLNRKYIGFELNKNYVNLTKKRIDNTEVPLIPIE